MDATPQSAGVTFFSLPRELRDQIYDEYIKSSVSPPESFGSQVRKPHFDQQQFEGTVKRLASIVPSVQDELIERFYALNNDFGLQFSTPGEIRSFLADDVFCPPRFHQNISACCKFSYHTTKKNAEGRRLAQKLTRLLDRIYVPEVHEPFPVLDVTNAQEFLEFLEVDLEDGRSATITRETGHCCGFTVKFESTGWHISFAVSCNEGYLLLEGDIGECGLLRNEH